MKFLIIGDLHGKKPKIHFKDFDAIIMTGDVCSDKEIAPYYKQYFKELKTNKNIPDFDTYLIQKIGKGKIKQIEKNSLKEGRKILQELNKLGKPIFMVAGNWDQSYGYSKIKDLDKSDYHHMKAFLDWWAGNKINPKLTQGLSNIKDCMLGVHKFNNVNFLGYGLSSGPEKIKRKKRMKEMKVIDQEKLKRAYNKIIDKLKKAYNKRNKKFPTIFITHNIPYNTKLDIVKDKKSYAYKKHLGSTIARDFCTKYQPLLCIGGHIHDNFGKDKIKRTIVINPSTKQVLIDIDEKKGKIKKIEFYKR